MTAPTFIVYNIAGNVVWGPKQIGPDMVAADLACQLDRPLNCPGVKLVFGAKILEPDTDLKSLGDSVELQVNFDTPKPFDHSFVRALVELAEEACDDQFFAGDVLPPEIVEIPNVEVVHAEIHDGSDDDDGTQLKLRMRVPADSPLIRERGVEEVAWANLQLEGGSVSGGPRGGDGCVVAEVLEEGDGSLLLEGVVPFDLEDCCYDLEFIDGKVQQLVKKQLAKVVHEGVSFETGIVSSNLTTKLNKLVDELKAASPADYHPGSKGVVRDLVHPSLYPYIKGVSETTGDLDVAPAGVGGRDMWGRPYETSDYQWLPAEVKVDAHGKCTFETYINNLDREKYGPLYGALEELLSRCITHLEGAWGHGKAVPAPLEDDSDCDDSDCSAGDPEALETVSLKDRTIQVITKIVDYELSPGATHEGVWHVEGMSHENIVATAELILQKDDALTGGALEFQRAFTSSEGGSLVMGFPQCRPRSLDDIVDKGLVPLGHLPLPAGRLACWPNSHIHRVTALKNTSDEPATRRIVVFWLINPDVRIVSTKNVPPQQGVMSLDDALQHREKLMEERKYEKQKWNLREVTLCEH